MTILRPQFQRSLERQEAGPESPLAREDAGQQSSRSKDHRKATRYATCIS